MPIHCWIEIQPWCSLWGLSIPACHGLLPLPYSRLRLPYAAFTVAVRNSHHPIFPLFSRGLLAFRFHSVALLFSVAADSRCVRWLKLCFSFMSTELSPPWHLSALPCPIFTCDRRLRRHFVNSTTVHHVHHGSYTQSEATLAGLILSRFAVSTARLTYNHLLPWQVQTARNVQM